MKNQAGGLASQLETLADWAVAVLAAALRKGCRTAQRVKMTTAASASAPKRSVCCALCQRPAAADPPVQFARRTRAEKGFALAVMTLCADRIGAT